MPLYLGHSSSFSTAFFSFSHHLCTIFVLLSDTPSLKAICIYSIYSSISHLSSHVPTRPCRPFARRSLLSISLSSLFSTQLNQTKPFTPSRLIVEQLHPSGCCIALSNLFCTSFRSDNWLISLQYIRTICIIAHRRLSFIISSFLSFSFLTGITRDSFF